MTDKSAGGNQAAGSGGELTGSADVAGGDTICSTCDGSGRKDGQECPQCQGTGTVVEPAGGA